MGKLILTSGDYILNSKNMDAIVNAQNKNMAFGSGICGAIYAAAGIRMLEYCRANYKDAMKVGEVRITPGFNLPMEVVHVLAPIYQEEDDPINKLMDVYENLLFEIKKKKYKKVLLPSLGTGSFGYRHEEVVKPLINLLNGFCKMNDIKLYLNNYSPSIKDIYLKYYLKINNIDIKSDLNKLDTPKKILDYLETNNLLEPELKEKYKNYVMDKKLEELSLSEKIICLGFIIQNFDVNMKQVKIITKSL